VNEADDTPQIERRLLAAKRLLAIRKASSYQGH